MLSTRILFFCVVGVVFVDNTVCAIRLHEGKYEEITVALSPELDVSQATDLINALKDLFKNASSVLCEATNKSLSYGSLNIILPRQWRNEFNNTVNGTDSLRQIGRREKLSLSNIIIANETNVNDVQQPKGCGQPGDFITLSSKSILNKEKDLEKLLVTLWSRWRYGVFSENSPGIHYHPDEMRFIPNSCTDHPLNFSTSLQDTQDYCEINWYTKDKCKTKITDEGNENITSSLLYKHDFPNMKNFCNVQTHNHFAETPHNLLCNGKSVWEIISISDDFKLSNKTQGCEESEDIKIQIIQPTYKRIYILVILKNFTKQITDSVASSLLMVAQHLLQPNDEIIVVFNDQVSLNTTLKEDKDTNIKNILTLINFDIKQLTDPCPLCAIENLIQKIMNDTVEDFDQLLFILTDVHDLSEIQNKTGEIRESTEKSISTKTPEISHQESEIDALSYQLIKINENFDKKNKTENLIKQLQNLTILVNTVAIGNSTDLELEDFSNKTGGKSYYLNDAHNLIKPILLNPLINSLKDDDISLESIYQNTIKGESVMVEKFYIDDHYKEVNIFINNFEDTDIIHLTTVNASKTGVLTTECSQMHVDSPVVLCTISQPEPTIGVLLIYQPVQHFNKSIHIFGIPKSNDVIQTSAWFNIRNPKVNLSENAFLIFAKISQKRIPYLDATVKAEITSENDTKFEIILLDNGIGPDIIKNDGIYTGQVVNCFSPKRHSVNINILGKTDKDASIGSFARNFLIGSVIFTDCQSNDLSTSFPVRDLSVIDMTDGNITVSWTESLRDDVIKSNDLAYQLMSMNYWTNDASNWTSDGESLKKFSTISFGSNHIENFQINFKNTNVSFIALVTKDGRGNFALSNIISVLNSSIINETTSESTPGSSNTTSETSPEAEKITSDSSIKSGEITQSQLSTITIDETSKSTTSSSGSTVVSDSTDHSVTTEETKNPKTDSSTNIETNTTVPNPDDNSKVDKVISGSSRTAAAGIIAVVVIVSIGGIAALSYYFVYYKRRERGDSSYSVGYSNLE